MVAASVAAVYVVSEPQHAENAGFFGGPSFDVTAVKKDIAAALDSEDEKRGDGIFSSASQDSLCLL